MLEAEKAHVSGFAPEAQFADEMAWQHGNVNVPRFGERENIYILN